MICTPVFALAADGGTLIGLVAKIKGIATDIVIPLLVTLAIAVFFWGIVVSIFKSGSDANAVKEGKTLLLWGIVALFVMVSIWGLVGIVSDTFDITSTGGAAVPQLGKY